MRKRAAVLWVAAGLTVLAVALAALLGLTPRTRILRLPVLGGTRLTTSEKLVAEACPNVTNARVSPDARRVACFVGGSMGYPSSGGDWVSGRARVLVDGVVGKEYSAVLPTSLCFGPDGKRLAYVAQGDSIEYSETPIYVVVDGTPFGPYRGAVPVPVFSPDGKRVAWVAEVARTRFLFMDGKRQGAAYEHTYGADVSFSADGKRIAFTVGAGRFVGNNSVVVQSIDAVERGEKADPVIEPYGYVGRLLFSPDSRHFAFWVRGSFGQYPVLDGVKQKPTESEKDRPFGDLIFSPDSRRLAYVSESPGSEFAVVDGVEGKRYDSIRSGLVFSSDSQRLAYAASRGNNKWTEVIGNTESREYEEVRAAGVFSPDAKRTAYAASLTGKWFAVVDGGPGKQYEEIRGGPLFGPDSRHIAYLAQRTGKWFVVVDGVESKEYDRYVGEGNLVFDGPNLVRAIMQRGDQVLRVEVKMG